MGLRRHVRINTTGLLATHRIPAEISMSWQATPASARWRLTRTFKPPLFGSRHPSNVMTFPRSAYFPKFDGTSWKVLVVCGTPFPWSSKICTPFALSLIAIRFLIFVLCVWSKDFWNYSPLLQQAFPPTSICPIWFIAWAKPEIDTVGNRLDFLPFQKIFVMPFHLRSNAYILDQLHHLAVHPLWTQ